MAACMPEMVVCKSCATVEMETFMTVLSRIMMNCAEAKIAITSHFFIRPPRFYRTLYPYRPITLKVYKLMLLHTVIGITSFPEIVLYSDECKRRDAICIVLPELLAVFRRSSKIDTCANKRSLARQFSL